jgi:hypothetical protein
MPNRNLPTPVVDTFDDGFVTYLRLVSWNGDWRYQSYRHQAGHQAVDVWSRPLALRGNPHSPAIQLEITKTRPSAPIGFNLICYWWVQKEDGADPVIMYSHGGVEEVDNSLSTVLAKLDLHREIYEEIIEKALYQHPQLIGATSPESELPTSSIWSSPPISSMHSRPPKRARDRVEDPEAIKRSCLRGKLDYIEKRRSCDGNSTLGSRSLDRDSVLSEGFENSIMINYSGKGASSATWTSSRLPRYPLGGDQSAMEQ